MTIYSRNSKNARAAEIQQFCKKRGIETLIHFTRSQNLSSILQKGLLSRSILERQSQEYQPQYNDLYRIDGYREAICLSISFPNYQMFYRYSQNERQNWVVLGLHSSLLWTLDCAFCWENAASNNIRRIPINVRRQAQSFKQLFWNYGDINREDLGIPENYTTHPQAEVLVFNKIAPQYIREVDFYDLVSAQQWLSDQQVNYDQNFYYGNNYFYPRQDYRVWSIAR